MKALFALSVLSAATAFPDLPTREGGHVWNRAQVEAAGLRWAHNHSNSHELLAPVPAGSTINWCNVKGKTYCTPILNQHIPQYCGACWAHAAVSAIGDRIRIAQGGEGMVINLAVQHILNCGNVGSCHGGSIDGPYQWLQQISEQGQGLAYYSQNPYVACSSESQMGFCQYVDTTCTPLNVARACGTFTEKCAPLSQYPNATLSDYGSIRGAEAMKKEIYNRGPISCGVDAAPLLKYASGIATAEGSFVDHVVSVVGWDKDPSTGEEYWIVRNSWGESWGEMGFFRVKLGVNALLLESGCAWGVPGPFTTASSNIHCSEGGEQCGLSGLGAAGGGQN